MRNIQLSRGYREFITLPAWKGTSPITEGLVSDKVPGPRQQESSPDFTLNFHLHELKFLKILKNCWVSGTSMQSHATATARVGREMVWELQVLWKPAHLIWGCRHLQSQCHITSALFKLPEGHFTKINSPCKTDGNDLKNQQSCTGETNYHSFSLKSSIYWHNKVIAWEANLFHIIYSQYSSKDAFWGSRKNFILQSLVIQPCWSCPHTNQWWHIFSTSRAKIIFQSISGSCHCCHSKPLLFPLFYHHWCNPTSVNSKHGLLLQLLN